VHVPSKCNSIIIIAEFIFILKTNYCLKLLGLISMISMITNDYNDYKPVN
jgi:hypothetical protein